MHVDGVLGDPDACDAAAGQVGANLAEHARMQRDNPRHSRGDVGDALGGVLRGRRVPFGHLLHPGWAAGVSRLVIAVVLDVHVVDGDVDFGDLQAGHLLDRCHHVAADAVGQVGDRDPVVGDDVDVDGGLLLACRAR